MRRETAKLELPGLTQWRPHLSTAQHFVLPLQSESYLHRCLLQRTPDLNLGHLPGLTTGTKWEIISIFINLDFQSTKNSRYSRSQGVLNKETETDHIPTGLTHNA